MSDYTSGFGGYKVNAEPLKAGQLLHFDKGEYSDYQTVGFFVVLQDFSPFDELTAFPLTQYSGVSKYGDDAGKRWTSESFESNAFIGSLIQKGFLMEITFCSLWLGAYDDKPKWTNGLNT